MCQTLPKYLEVHPKTSNRTKYPLHIHHATSWLPKLFLKNALRVLGDKRWCWAENKEETGWGDELAEDLVLARCHNTGLWGWWGVKQHPSVATGIPKNTSWLDFLMLRQALGEEWWSQTQGHPCTEGKAARKALPVLWGVGEGGDDVLLDEEEHGEEKAQPHGTHHRPNGQGLHRGQHKQAVRGVVVKFGHCKEDESHVRTHLLVQPSTFYPHHELLGSKQESRSDALACGSLEAMDDGSIWLVWFIFFPLHPLRTWLPSWWTRSRLVLVRHYRYLSKTKEGNLFSTDARSF